MEVREEGEGGREGEREREGGRERGRGEREGGGGREGGRERERGGGREREREKCYIHAGTFLLPHRLIGWGQIRRGVVYKPPTEGGTTT